jgi:hypothetical protein
MKRRMLSRCTICSHQEHTQIDASLTCGVSVTLLSKRYGVSIHAIYRHKDNHLSEAAKARIIAGPDYDEDQLAKIRTKQSGGLLRENLALRGRMYAWLQIAEDNGDGPLAVKITAQIHESMNMAAKMVDALPRGTSVNITNILVAEPYLDLRNEIVKALRNHPAAARAVANVLHKHEAAAAKQITLEARPMEVSQ